MSRLSIRFFFCSFASSFSSSSFTFSNKCSFSFDHHRTQYVQWPVLHYMYLICHSLCSFWMVCILLFSIVRIKWKRMKRREAIKKNQAEHAQFMHFPVVCSSHFVQLHRNRSKYALHILLNTWEHCVLHTRCGCSQPHNNVTNIEMPMPTITIFFRYSNNKNNKKKISHILTSSKLKVTTLCEFVQFI